MPRKPYKMGLLFLIPFIRDPYVLVSDPKMKTHIQIRPRTRTNNSKTGVGRGLGIYFCYDEDNYHGMITYIIVELWTEQ